LIEERDGNDNITRQYIYGNGIDEIIRMDVYDGGTVSSYYFHTDAIGSVTAITDENGNIVERYTYDIYGMPTFWDASGNVIPASSIGNNILFQGREYSPELNLYYFRARYFDPIMGRFLSVDPMGYKDSMNLYQALNQNPVNFVDPFGLFIRTKKWIKGYAPIEVESGDTMEELASLLPGITEKEVRNYIPNIIPGKEINVSPLIDEFESKTRTNIALFAKKATKFFGLDFSSNPSNPANPAHLKEIEIIDLFDSSKYQKGFQSGCFYAATIIVARGIISTLDPGEWDALNILQYEKAIDGSKMSLYDIPIGERIHLYNKIDKNHRLLRSHGVQAEWVVKIDEDNYYGFGYPGGKTTGNYSDWLNRLASTYDKYTGEKITSNQVVGYYGKFYTMDYFRIAQAVFDYRNEK
jgi:RHS repeat-associated protein